MLIILISLLQLFLIIIGKVSYKPAIGSHSLVWEFHKQSPLQEDSTDIVGRGQSLHESAWCPPQLTSVKYVQMSHDNENKCEWWSWIHNHLHILKQMKVVAQNEMGY